MAGLAASALFVVMSGVAGAQDAPRWLAQEGRAEAQIPVPAQAQALSGAMLSCAGQEWMLTLASDVVTLRFSDRAQMSVDGKTFFADASASPGLVRIGVPREMLDPMRKGLQLGVDFEGVLAAPLGKAGFTLIGSRVAIEAVQDICSLPDMSAYRSVTFSPYSSHLNLGRELRGADIEAFAFSTASQPQLSVAMVKLDGDRRLLFTRLCGSSWYFGLTGCNVTGFAPEGSDGWRPVYESEGAHLYLDAAASSGELPDILALPLRGPADQRRWTWAGEAGYRPAS